MADESIPDDLRDFILRHIDSVAQLEALLLLRANPDGQWNVATTATRAVVTFQSFVGIVGTEWAVGGVGDFDGNGRSDLLMRRDDGLFALYLIGGDPPAVLAANLLGYVGPHWTLAGVGDFNGDGKADTLFRRSTDGALALYLWDGFELQAAQMIGAVGTEWTNCLPNP